MYPKKILFFGLLLFYISLKAQFSNKISHEELYILTSDSRVYLHILVKDKLYLFNKTKVKEASQELDYVIARFYNNLAVLDEHISDEKLLDQLNNIKLFWKKFEPYLIKNLSIDEYKKFHFEVNAFDRLLKVFDETMFRLYKFDEKSWKNFKDIQKLKILVEKITSGFLAKYLKINQSLTKQFLSDIVKMNLIIKDKSNGMLNDILFEKKFLLLINDWNFFKRNINFSKMNNIKTVFSLSLNMNEKLNEIASNYLKWDIL